jgi:hypothetical protein
LLPDEAADEIAAMQPEGMLHPALPFQEDAHPGEVAAVAAGDRATTAEGDTIWVLTHPSRSFRPPLGGGFG